MTKNILALLFVNFFCGSIAFAQLNPFPSAFIDLDTNEAPVLRFQSFYLSNSSTINARLVRHYQFSRRLSRELINNNEPRLQEENRAGVNFMSTLSYTINPASSFLGNDISYIFSYTNETMSGIQFSGDAYRLGLMGNTRYKGKTLHIEPLHNRRQTFSAIKAAAYKHNSGWTYGGGIALVTGHKFSFAHVYEGSLYTSPDADSLHVIADIISGRSSDTVQHWLGPMQIRGIGPSVELGIKYETKNYKISLLLENIGFITWTQPAVYNMADTVIAFTRVEYEELVNNSGEYEGIFSIERRFRRSSDELEKTRMLPWRARLHQEIFVDAIQSDITLGILYENLPGFFPYIYIIANHDATADLNLQGGFTFGGYGSGGLALGATYQFTGFEAGLAGYNLLSFLFPDDISGTSLQVKLAKKLAK